MQDEQIAEPGAVLLTLQRMLGYNRSSLARLLHKNRATIIRRTESNDVALSRKDYMEMAEALGVPASLFYGTARDAARWVVDNRPEIFDLDYQPAGEDANSTLLSFGGVARARRCTIHLARAS